MNKLACAMSVLSVAVLNACIAIDPGPKPAAGGQGTKPPASGQGANTAGSRQPASPLFDTVAVLDAAVFDAFNHCSAPRELQKHAGYFAPDVEFYHDEGRVTWKRSEMIANTRKNVCGKFRRELVIDDPEGLLKWLGKDRAMVEFGSLDELKGKGAAFQGVLRQWIAYV